AAVDRRRALAAWMVPAGIALVVIACFLPTLRNDFVLWDDDLNFTDNPSYRGLSWRHLRWMFTTVHGGHYQPLSWVTLGLDYLLWGLNPMGYHLTSVVLHAANAVLFYDVVRMLVRERLEAASAERVARWAGRGWPSWRRRRCRRCGRSGSTGCWRGRHRPSTGCGSTCGRRWCRVACRPSTCSRRRSTGRRRATWPVRRWWGRSRRRRW